MKFDNILKTILYKIYNTFEAEATAVYKKVNSEDIMTYAKFRTYLTDLEKQKLIALKTVSISVKGGNRLIILATEQGERYALRFFDKILQEREPEKLLRVHGTLEHGYFNKYCVDILKAQNYELYDEYKDNRFETSLIGENGQSLICESDFNIVYNNSRYLFEAETGKCQDINVHQKLDKAYNLACNNVIATTLFYICPNKKACEKIEKAIDDWRRDNGVYSVYNTVVINASAKDGIIKGVSKSIKKEEANCNS